MVHLTAPSLGFPGDAARRMNNASKRLEEFEEDDMTPPVVPLVAGIGPPEIILIILVIVLLFGAKKLPELARGSGRALRIFKAETKGLMGDDDEDEKDRRDQQDHAQPDRREIDRGPVQADSVRTDVSYDDQRRPDTDR